MSNYDVTKPDSVSKRVEFEYQVQKRVQTNPEIWQVWYTIDDPNVSREQARGHFERVTKRPDTTGVFRLVEKKREVTTSRFIMEQEEIS